jgi:transposase
MARPYSLDLRERVVAAVKAGGACREVAATFDVAPSTVVKWSGRQRETGSAAAKPMGGKRRCPLEAQREFLLVRIAEKPDIRLRELAAELAKRGVTVSHVSVWNLFRREGQSFKKNCARQRAGPA